MSKFDFELTDAQERRAMQLHRESIVWDLLSQHAGGNIFQHFPPDLRAAFEAQMAQAPAGFAGYWQAVYWPYEMSRLGKSHLIQEWYAASGLTCGSCATIAVHDDGDREAIELEKLAARYAALPWMRYVTTAQEIRQAKRDGFIAFYANWQPTTPIPRNLHAIDAAYARGLRSLMLTYNLMDHVGVGCTERVDAGLSRFGIDVVRHCNELGLIVDVSHCGPLTTLDACRHSRSPVNANHTAARGIYAHARGKEDDALRAIADTGGVIGVVAVPAFITADDIPTIEHLLNHIDYISHLVGWEHVAIGTDWPLQAPEALQRKLLSPDNKELGFRDRDRLDVTRRLAGFDDCRDLPNITRGLVKRGYSDEQVRGILGENALRVFAVVCG